MSDKPILFSGPMVRALLAGTKTQTRRFLSLRGHRSFTEFDVRDTVGYDWHFRDAAMRWHDLRDAELKAKLRIAVGDRLYVREAWRPGYNAEGWREDLGRVARPSDFDPKTTAIEYLADGTRELGGDNRPGIHMPKWASRLTLHVTEVRVQRLHDISEADALAEGMTDATAEAIMTPDELALYASTHILCPDARGRLLYQHIWDEINGTREVPEPWALNPWVAAYTFEVEHANIANARAA